MCSQEASVDECLDHGKQTQDVEVSILTLSLCIPRKRYGQSMMLLSLLTLPRAVEGQALPIQNGGLKSTANSVAM